MTTTSPALETGNSRPKVNDAGGWLMKMRFKSAWFRRYRLRHCCVCGAMIKEFSIICDYCCDWWARIAGKAA